MLADRESFRAILRENAVEQNEIGGDLLHLRGLCIERALRCGDEEAKHQRSDSGDQADAKAHHVLGMFVQMILWQDAAQQRAEPYAAQHHCEYDTRQT